MTRLTGRSLRVTVFVGEDDTWHHRHADRDPGSGGLPE